MRSPVVQARRVQTRAEGEITAHREYSREHSRECSLRERPDARASRWQRVGLKLAVDVEETSTSPTHTRRTPLYHHAPRYLRSKSVGNKTTKQP